MFGNLKGLRGYVKKGFRHAKNAVGAISHGEDTSKFDSRVKEWENQVETVKRIKECLEVYLDALGIVNLAGVALGDSIQQHFSYICASRDETNSTPQISPYLDVANLFMKINTDIVNVIQPAIVEVMKNRCMLPLNEILSSIPEILDKLSIRKNLIIDRDVYKTKVEKDTAAKNPNMTDLQRHQIKLKHFNDEVEKIQTILYDLFDDFDEAMPTLFGNEMSSLIATLYYYSSSTSVLLSQALPFIPQTQSTLCLLSMATATNKFLQSPEFTQDLENRIEKALVPPLYNRTEVYGGQWGEYGTVYPDVSAGTITSSNTQQQQQQQQQRQQLSSQQSMNSTTSNNYNTTTMNLFDSDMPLIDTSSAYNVTSISLPSPINNMIPSSSNNASTNFGSSNYLGTTTTATSTSHLMSNTTTATSSGTNTAIDNNINPTTTTSTTTATAKNTNTYISQQSSSTTTTTTIPAIDPDDEFISPLHAQLLAQAQEEAYQKRASLFTSVSAPSLTTHSQLLSSSSSSTTGTNHSMAASTNILQPLPVSGLTYSKTGTNSITSTPRLPEYTVEPLSASSSRPLSGVMPTVTNDSNMTNMTMNTTSSGSSTTIGATNNNITSLSQSTQRITIHLPTHSARTNTNNTSSHQGPESSRGGGGGNSGNLTDRSSNAAYLAPPQNSVPPRSIVHNINTNTTTNIQSESLKTNMSAATTMTTISPRLDISTELSTSQLTNHSNISNTNTSMMTSRLPPPPHMVSSKSTDRLYDNNINTNTTTTIDMNTFNALNRSATPVNLPPNTGNTTNFFPPALLSIPSVEPTKDGELRLTARNLEALSIHTQQHPTTTNAATASTVYTATSEKMSTNLTMNSRENYLGINTNAAMNYTTATTYNSNNTTPTHTSYHSSASVFFPEIPATTNTATTTTNNNNTNLTNNMNSGFSSGPFYASSSNTSNYTSRNTNIFDLKNPTTVITCDTFVPSTPTSAVVSAANSPVKAAINTNSNTNNTSNLQYHTIIKSLSTDDSDHGPQPITIPTSSSTSYPLQTNTNITCNTSNTTTAAMTMGHITLSVPVIKPISTPTTPVPPQKPPRRASRANSVTSQSSTSST